MNAPLLENPNRSFLFLLYFEIYDMVEAIRVLEDFPLY